MHLSPLVALFGLAASALAVPTSSVPGSKAVRTLHRFPNQWAENLAVRKSGPILATFLSAPEVWQVDPDTKKAVLVARFPKKLGALGIVETSPDVFAVAVGNFSITTRSVANPNASTIYTVDVRHFNARTGKGAKVTKVVDIPEAVFLNGGTALDAKNGLVLFGDSTLGAVFRVDVHTGRYKKVLQDPLFLPPAGQFIGINGIRTSGSTLYFVNLYSGIFGRVALKKDGSAAGPVEKLIANVGGDDFALAPALPGQQPKTAYLATNGVGNSILKLDLVTRTSKLVAGALNSSLVAGGTSLQYGRRLSDKHTLYGTTSGLFNGTQIGAAVYAVDLKKL